MYCDDCKASSPRILVHVSTENFKLLTADKIFKEQALEQWNKRVND